MIIATKSDRLPANKMRNTVAKLGSELENLRVLPYSAKTGMGREELWQEIRPGRGPTWVKRSIMILTADGHYIS